MAYLQSPCRGLQLLPFCPVLPVGCIPLVSLYRRIELRQYLLHHLFLLIKGYRSKIEQELRKLVISGGTTVVKAAKRAESRGASKSFEKSPEKNFFRSLSLAAGGKKNRYVFPLAAGGPAKPEKFCFSLKRTFSSSREASAPPI